MLRISAGVSLCFTLLAVGGGLAACSSDSTGGGGSDGSSSGGTSSTGGTAGKGSVITGGDDGGGTGTGGGRAGSTSGGTGTGGGACAATVVCVDAATAQTCDPVTGETSTVKCTDLQELGVDSTACEGDATSGTCNGDLKDAECEAGATAFAVCGMFTDDQYFQTYVNCFQDNVGQDGQQLRPLILCGAKYLDEAAMTVDCDGAQADCLGAGAGGDGAGGAGGSPG